MECQSGGGVSLRYEGEGVAATAAEEFLLFEGVMLSNNTAEGGGGGGVYIQGYAVEPLTESFAGADMAWNEAAYGDLRATEARSIVLLNGNDTSTTLQQSGELAKQPGIPLMGIKDAYGQTVASDFESFIQLRVSKEVPSALPGCNAQQFIGDSTITEGASQRVTGGVAQFSSLTVIAQPGNCSVLEPESSGGLATSPFGITFDVCPAGATLAGLDRVCSQCLEGRYKDWRGNEECLPCPAGTAVRDRGSTACQVCEPGTFARGGVLFIIVWRILVFMPFHWVMQVPLSAILVKAPRTPGMAGPRACLVPQVGMAWSIVLLHPQLPS